MEGRKTKGVNEYDNEDKKKGNLNRTMKKWKERTEATKRNKI